MPQGSPDQLKALIVGGGVAGLEAILALRALAGEAVDVTLLANEPDFVYRPMTVREPFGYSRAQRYSLAEIAAEQGVELIADSFQRLEPEADVVHTDGARRLGYDALVLGMGARISPGFNHSITIDDRHLDEQFHGLIQDVEDGYVNRLAFIAPSPMPWPLPMYELALMVARRAYDMNIHMSITIATPEPAPLALFGTTVSEFVEKLLEEQGILTLPSAHCEVPEQGVVEIRPGTRSLHVDRIVALPRLLGLDAPGVPTVPPDGFIPVDESCRVRGLERAWAAGDATDFPVKLGGIAAQQADVAAVEIARLAGISVETQSFQPEIHAILLGARRPLYLSAQITGGHGISSELSETPTWSASAKIAARRLGPYLETHDRLARRTG